MENSSFEHQSAEKTKIESGIIRLVLKEAKLNNFETLIDIGKLRLKQQGPLDTGPTA